MLDVENKRLAENLATKVSRLKSVSEDIGPAANLRSHSLLLVNSVLVKWWITPVFVSFNVSACVWDRPRSRGPEWLPGQHGEEPELQPAPWGTYSSSSHLPHFLFFLLLQLGFQLPERHRPAKRQRQAFLHHGPLWPRQPPHSVLRVGGRGRGLLPALLHGVQDPELIGDGWGCGPLLQKKTLVYSKQTESRVWGCPQCGSDTQHKGVVLADGWLWAGSYLQPPICLNGCSLDILPDRKWPSAFRPVVELFLLLDSITTTGVNFLFGCFGKFYLWCDDLQTNIVQTKHCSGSPPTSCQTVNFLFFPLKMKNWWLETNREN